MSLICPPPESNEKLMAWQKSYFTREQRSSVKKAISLTSYFYLTTFSVQGGERGYFILQVAAGVAENNIGSKFLICYSITVSTSTLLEM